MKTSGRPSDERTALASRLRQARERLGLTQQELALRAGLPAAQSVSAIENGERDVKAVELRKLAEALHIGLSDLLLELPVQPSVLWRQQPENDQARLDTEARLFELCRHFSLAEQWTGLNKPCALIQRCPPQRLDDYSYAEAIAAEIRRWLDTGSYPALTLIRALEEDAGVRILYQRALPGSAACMKSDDLGAAILVNASESRRRRNYSIAHELFHLLLWDHFPPERLRDRPDEWKAMETLANSFASALLLPAEALVHRVDGRSHNGRLLAADLVELAREFDVSVDALVWRLVNLRQLGRSKAEELLRSESLRALDRAAPAEPVEEPDEFPTRLLRLLALAYAKGKVSIGRVAQMTGQDLAEMREQLAVYSEEGDAAQAQFAVA